MKTLLKILGGLVVLVLAVAACGYGYLMFAYPKVPPPTAFKIDQDLGVAKANKGTTPPGAKPAAKKVYAMVGLRNSTKETFTYRLEAEPTWDAIWASAGGLDMAVGGPSFDPSGGRGGRRSRSPDAAKSNRRAAYMIRGYSTSRDVVPVFLQAFDVDDGRVPCPVRTRTVTPPQALFLMNGEAVERATERFAERLDYPGESPSLSSVHHTFSANLTGQPALSVPCGFSADRLPIGFQLLGRPFDEATIFRIARAYEREHDWPSIRPEVRFGN